MTKTDILLTEEVTPMLIRAITRRIVEALDPEKIILFGSYAYGEPTIDSDIDLLIIMESELRPVERAQAVSNLFLRRYFGLDILVRTPQELAERLALRDPFFIEITEKGRVLYDRRSARVGIEGRKRLSSRARPRKKAQTTVARSHRVRLRAVR